MIQKKICMIGSFAVGKTSLVTRFVKSIFTEKYLTTIGVKIDKKTATVNDQEINMILWDIHGEDDFQQISMSYLRGSSGYLLIVDGTRKNTLDKAFDLHDRVVKEYGELPFILVLNKFDLKSDWEIDENDMNLLLEKSWEVIHTSAKSGDGVEAAFNKLAQKMMEVNPQ